MSARAYAELLAELDAAGRAAGLEWAAWLSVREPIDATEAGYGLHPGLPRQVRQWIVMLERACERDRADVLASLRAAWRRSLGLRG